MDGWIACASVVNDRANFLFYLGRVLMHGLMRVFHNMIGILLQDEFI